MVICPRIDKRTGEPLLFMRDDEGGIMCYAHIGQHSNASLDYYRKDTRPARADECDALIAEYRAIPPSIELQISKRLPRYE